MNPLQLASILEKNKISNTTAYFTLLEIDIPGLTNPVRIVLNNEDITWNGLTWTAFSFEVGDITYDEKEEPTIDFKVSNINKVIGGYVEDYSGGDGATVRLIVVNSANLDSTTADTDETFVVSSANITNSIVSFRVGSDSATTIRRPACIYNGRCCRWKFKSVQCGYNGVETTCNKTLSRCRELNNSIRWGAFYGISGKIY